jgi:hypothetical protein
MKTRVVLDFDWTGFPGLASRALAKGEAIEIEQEFAGAVSSVRDKEILALGMADLENGEPAEPDWEEWFYFRY